MTAAAPGTLYGVGVGPGDPELMTVKAIRLLSRASVVAYPAPEEGDSLARSIAQEHIPPGCAEIALRLPFDPARSPADAYEAGAKAIAAHLTAGRDVVCLCAGDPMLYGSFVTLSERLQGRFPVKIVPGVSSLTASAAVLGQALAMREDSLVVIPATRPAADIERLVLGADAVAIIKLGRHVAKVARILERLGLADRARCVERAGLPGEKVRTLAEAVAEGIPYFSMILVHRRGGAWRA
jgi:precorrin-2/cobalt-factor-2 C20-methyltransferase